MLEYIRDIDLTKWIGVQENNIAQYKGVAGVWILLGRDKGDTRLVCLQAGQTITGVGDEIKKDISYLVDENFEPMSIDEKFNSAGKKYVNQFGESMFPYDKHMNRRKMLYRDIAKKYEDLTFVCIAHGNELKNQAGLLKTIEKYAAFKTLCRYWVNGRPYSKKRSPEEIEQIKKECTDACVGLFKTIKDNYPEKADSLNEFLDKFINGDIDDLIPGK